MRTTLNLDEELFRKVVQMTGLKEKTKLVHMGLQALLRNAAYQRLSKLHGAIKEAKAPPRRKMW